MKRKRGFTLLELVVVIIIIAVLASLGFSQYNKIVERSRWTEARVILGNIRKSTIIYWLERGTTAGISNADVNTGTTSDQIPSSCRPSHYFYYDIYTDTYWVNPWAVGRAFRCTSGGKEPQATEPIGPMNNVELAFTADGSQPEQWCFGPQEKGNCYSGRW